jgi:crossover junction endodeoxyribonuclease RusA
MIISAPWPHSGLSPNARLHRAQKATLTKGYKATVGWEAKAQGIRRIEARTLFVTITFHPPDKRPRDRDNMIASCKAAQDAIAALIGVDDSRWVPTYRVGEPIKGGRVVFAFPEVTVGMTDAELLDDARRPRL